MKKIMFSTMLTALMLLLGTSAFAFTQTIDVNSGYQFVNVDWTHTYDGSVPGPVTATLSIYADDVDMGEIDKVYLNGTYLGDLVSYGAFDNNRPPGAPVNTSVTIFDVTPFLSAIMNMHIEVFNGASSYAVEILTSTLTVSSTPIPGAIWLLGSGLVGLVGIRRKFA